MTLKQKLIAAGILVDNIIWITPFLSCTWEDHLSMFGDAQTYDELVAADEFVDTDGVTKHYGCIPYFNLWKKRGIF